MGTNMNSTFLRSRILLALAMTLAGMDLAVLAEDGFRVDTDVTEGGQAKPVQRSITFFHNGVAYNLSQDSGELMVVDWKNDRIILLNTKQEIQTTVEISRLQHLLESARTQSAATSLVGFVKGAEKVQSEGSKIRVGDQLMLYEATMQRPDDEDRARDFAQQYRQFADATKLLSAFAGPPPFHRLQLNEAICDEHSLPDVIELKIRVGDDTVTYKSTLHVIWTLSRKDQQRITEIGDMLVTFDDMDYREFQKRNVQQVKTDPQ